MERRVENIDLVELIAENGNQISFLISILIDIEILRMGYIMIYILIDINIISYILTFMEIKRDLMTIRMG